MREHDIDRDPPSADLFAAEYALGVLDAARLREARERARREPAFARLVDDWTQRLDAVNDELAPVEPPVHVWPRVRSRLGWSPVAGGADRGRLRLWQGATAAGFATAAALAAVVLMRPQVAPQPQPAPPIVQAPTPEPARVAQGLADMPLLPVTKLVHDDGSPAFLASIDRDSGGMWLVPMPGGTKTGDRLPVLWLIPQGGTPRVLGFVNVQHSHWVEVPKEMRGELAGGSVLAVTLEPAGKTPPQAPSSAPVATGGITL
ncbi:anti-sigma factor [Lysobacter humi (ex Lee et al. 2017)]